MFVPAYGLLRSDYDLMTKTIPNVTGAVRMRELVSEARYLEKTMNIRLVGCTTEYADMNHLSLLRGRFLSDEEYGALGASLDEASQSGENPLAISAIRAIALTGCRLQEIAKLRHDELDLQTSHLRIANGKEGHAVLPLGESAKAVLTAVPKQPKHPNSPYVFATNRGLPYTALPKAFKRIVEKAKLEGVTLHTLRHSFATCPTPPHLKLLTFFAAFSVLLLAFPEPLAPLPLL